jgi:acyl-CoA thioesterase FadM
MRYFETARMQYLIDVTQYLPNDLRATLTQPTIELDKEIVNKVIPEQTVVGPIISHVTTRYRAQVRYPDTLTYWIRIRAEDLEKMKAQAETGCSSGDRILLEYVAVSHRLEKIVADGNAMLVAFDYPRNRKANIPLYLAKAIYQWEIEGRNYTQSL